MNGIEEHETTMDYELPLTDTERAELADKAAELEAEIDDLEDDFDRKKKAHKGKVDLIESKRKDIMRKIRRKKAMKTVEVIIQKDYNNNQVQFIHKETGAVLEERDMYPEERQGDLSIMEVVAEQVEGVEVR